PAPHHVKLDASPARPLEPIEQRGGVTGEAIQVEDHHDLGSALTDPRVQALEALTPPPADSVIAERIGELPALRRRISFDLSPLILKGDGPLPGFFAAPNVADGDPSTAFSLHAMGSS